MAGSHRARLVTALHTRPPGTEVPSPQATPGGSLCCRKNATSTVHHHSQPMSNQEMSRWIKSIQIKTNHRRYEFFSCPKYYHTSQPTIHLKNNFKKCNFSSSVNPLLATVYQTRYNPPCPSPTTSALSPFYLSRSLRLPPLRSSADTPYIWDTKSASAQRQLA